jgi:hypothetical protein
MADKSVKLQAAAIFTKAAQYIREVGWQEKGMAYDGIARCSMGALESAYPAKHWNKDLASFMYEKLYTKLNGINLTEFNKRAKNGLEVARLFEEVAESIRNTYEPNYKQEVYG